LRANCSTPQDELPEASGQLLSTQAAMAPRSRRQQELRAGGGGAAGGGLSWAPYLVVLALVCLGPARPLIRPMIAFLWPAHHVESTAISGARVGARAQGRG